MTLLGVRLLVLLATVWIPWLSYNPPLQAQHTIELRIDNIPLANLDDALSDIDIDKETRALIIKAQLEERTPKPGARTVEETVVGVEPAWTGPWMPCVCPEGEGVTVVYKTAGMHRSHFLLAPNTDTGWTMAKACPMFHICTVVSTLSPGPGKVLAWQGFASMLPLPVPLMWNCNTFLT